MSSAPARGAGRGPRSFAALAVGLELSLRADDYGPGSSCAPAEGLDLESSCHRAGTASACSRRYRRGSAPVHEQEDDRLRLRSEVRLLGAIGLMKALFVVVASALLSKKAVRREQPGEAEASEPRARLPEELAPGAAAEGCRGHWWFLSNRGLVDFHKHTRTIGTPTVAILVIVSVRDDQVHLFPKLLELISGCVHRFGHRYPHQSEGSKGLRLRLTAGRGRSGRRVAIRRTSHEAFLPTKRSAAVVPSVSHLIVIDHGQCFNRLRSTTAVRMLPMVSAKGDDPGREAVHSTATNSLE